MVAKPAITASRSKFTPQRGLRLRDYQRAVQVLNERSQRPKHGQRRRDPVNARPCQGIQRLQQRLQPHSRPRSLTFQNSSYIPRTHRCPHWRNRCIGRAHPLSPSLGLPLTSPKSTASFALPLKLQPTNESRSPSSCAINPPSTPHPRRYSAAHANSPLPGSASRRHLTQSCCANKCDYPCRLGRKLRRASSMIISPVWKTFLTSR